MCNSGYIRLIQLQREDRFVFHGSGLSLSALEPRQAYTIRDCQKIEDGDPAVWASHLVDYAVFMALINRENCPKSSQSMCDYTNEQLTFGATQDTLDQLSEEAIGYVHVFERGDFELRGGAEWMCRKHIKPLEVIVVNRQEFACPIKIIEPLVKQP